MHSSLTLALSAILVAAVFPAATAQFNSDPVIREPTAPNIKIRDDDGNLRAGLRCGVKQRTPLQRDVLERNLREFSKQSPFGALAESHGSITIPVWFHIVTKTSKGKNPILVGDVTDAQIADQLQVLNDAYAGRGFSFTHGGTTRTNNGRWFDGCARYSTETTMKAALAVDPALLPGLVRRRRHPPWCGGAAFFIPGRRHHQLQRRRYGHPRGGPLPRSRPYLRGWLRRTR